MNKTLLEKMEEAAKRPVPYEGLTSQNLLRPRPGIVNTDEGSPFQKKATPSLSSAARKKQEVR